MRSELPRPRGATFSLSPALLDCEQTDQFMLISDKGKVHCMEKVEMKNLKE
jgi:hypothetical protein